MNDWRGTPIEVGSKVVYAVTKSSSVTMVEAVVEEIGEEITARWDAPRTRNVLFVRRVDEHTRLKYGLGKRVKLTATERVTVVQ